MKKRFITVALLLIVIDIALVVAYVFLHISIRAHRAIATETGIAIGVERAKQENGAVLRKAVRDTDAVRAELARRYVETGEVPAFLESIEALGQKTGSDVSVRSVNVRPLNSAAASTTEYLAVAVHGEGTFAEIMSLDRRMESLPYALVVSDFALRVVQDSEKGKVPAWQLDLSFKALKKK